MKTIIKPKALKKGDTIAIITPSSNIMNFLRRTERAVRFLNEKGYQIKLMPNALRSDGYSGGTALERATDINQAFSDSSIDAILCSTGGLTANAVLPFIDYKLISKNPKIFCGYSDITTLLLMITSRCDMITFHGPTLLPSFGEYEGCIGFTFDQFEKIVSLKSGVGLLPSAKEFTTDNLYWERDDNKNLKMNIAPELIAYGPKKIITGQLFGGNLQTFVMLMHEPGFYDLNDAILFLEEESLGTDWYERYLNEIERKGIFEKIKGLIFAKPTGSFKDISKEKRPLTKIFEELSVRYNLPILANVDCGHTKPLLTFPLGIMAEIDTINNTISIKEAAVR